jgi:thiol-disulfide isomerase/thioredoxin
MTSSMPAAQRTAPDALLLMTSSCPHCPAVLQALSALLKAGSIGGLEAINLTVRPEAAEKFGVRSVPWVRIGPFELEGLRSQSELKQWAERAGTDKGMAEYFAQLLKDGDLKKALSLIMQDTARLDALVLLLGNPDTDLHVRVGIGAIMEHLQGSDLLRRKIEDLTALTRHRDARIRSDACHYLSLTQSRAAVPAVRALLNDPDTDVREVARDSLSALETTN